MLLYINNPYRNYLFIEVADIKGGTGHIIIKYLNAFIQENGVYLRVL